MNCSNDAVRGRQRLNNDSNDAKDEYALTRHHVLCRPARGCVPTPTTLAKVWSDVGEADGKLGFAGDRVAFHQTQCGEKVDVALWELGRQKGWPGIADPSISIWQGSGEEYRLASVPTTCRPVACLDRVAMAGPLINKSAFLSLLKSCVNLFVRRGTYPFLMFQPQQLAR